MIVVIDRFVAGIKRIFLQDQGDRFRLTEFTAGTDVGDRNSLSVHVPSTFTLVGSRCAAP